VELEGSRPGSHVHSDYHKLRFTKPNLNTKRELTTPITTQRTMSRTKSQLRSSYGGAVGDTPNDKKDDYFHLLTDRSRKSFNPKDVEGTDAFYSDEQVMNRIYKQGFRDPKYFGTPVRYNRLRAPEEKVIKDSYMFKISPWVASMENENTSATYLLGGGANNLAYIEVT